MSQTRSPKFSAALHAYVILIACLGAVAIGTSASQVIKQTADYQSQWLLLVGLTMFSGLLPVKLPTVNVSISISETFLIAGTLLFGPAGGTALTLLDAAFISLRLQFSRRLRWQQVLFNLSACPVSIWAAAHLSQIEPLFGTTPRFDGWFLLQLLLFTAIYFVLNSWLITGALALQQGVRATTIWRQHFFELLVNYAAGGSIATLLVYNTQRVDPFYVAAILPLLFILFLTYQVGNKRVEAERDKNAQLNRVFLSTIEALALAIDAKDQVTHGHIRRVQRYTMALAEALGITDQKQLDALRAAALLHDTGKLAVPEYILNKPGPLTPAEFERMKVHAAVGADILKSIDFPYPVEPIVRHHHENWNGTGYPDGLKAHSIPLGARILSVVDCYDALTSDRPYRPRYTRQHAEQVLRDRRGTWYDPWVVDAFLRILDNLEKLDADEALSGDSITAQNIIPAQLDVIAAATAEEREFNELRRDLPLAGSLDTAAEVLFRHMRRIVPAGTFSLFVPNKEGSELVVAASSGAGASAIEGLTIPYGDRISGWVAAHKQGVLNSNAALELGPVARTFTTPLRYALAVPLLGNGGSTLGVISAYGSDPFDGDHKRMLESAATLFASSVLTAPRAAKDPVPFGEKPQPRADSRVH